VLIAATSMGVKRIVLINPRRVDKSFWTSRAARDDAIRDQLILGLEQARDTRLPEVLKRPHFRSFVEDELPGLTKDGVSLVAHPGPALDLPRTGRRPVHLAVGPEGGFSEYEIEKFESTGFERVSLGDRILRVETAVPFLVASLLESTGPR
jgi:RsmE family RNA methyltransferase